MRKYRLSNEPKAEIVLCRSRVHSRMSLSDMASAGLLRWAAAAATRSSAPVAKTSRRCAFSSRAAANRTRPCLALDT